MFTSINEHAFRQAIKDKDYLALKVSTVSTMRDDPTFERGETMKAVQILKEQVPEIFEEEVKLDYEERLEKSEWDKGYFTKLTYWFQENFSLSRISYIKEVGRVVHKDTAEKYNRSMAMSKAIVSKAATMPKASGSTVAKSKPAVPQMATSAPKISQANQMQTTSTRVSKEKKGNFPVAGAIVAVGALVLVGILLIKLL